MSCPKTAGVLSAALRVYDQSRYSTVLEERRTSVVRVECSEIRGCDLMQRPIFVGFEASLKSSEDW